MNKNKPYGQELILDLYGCNIDRFNRGDIEEFFEQLCKLVDMKRENLHFWDYEGVPEDEISYDQPHLLGTSAVQFISTSNIVIHTLSLVKECYINLFSCKEFNPTTAIKFTKEWFGSLDCDYSVITRGKRTKC